MFIVYLEFVYLQSPAIVVIRLSAYVLAVLGVPLSKLMSASKSFERSPAPGIECPVSDNMGDQVNSPKCAKGWCGAGEKPRSFPKVPVVICYEEPAAVRVNREEYSKKRISCLTGSMVQEIDIPKREARTWTMNKGELCRISVVGGSQVGDLNLWNLEDKTERFYSGKTRQLHASHLTTYDRLWSCLPYLRPMATIVADSLAAYGIDEDGASCHDVIGTRCDQFTQQLITGAPGRFSCHKALTDAVREVGLEESDVHDVWNVFMCTGFTKVWELHKTSHKYFCKASPAVPGDYVDFIADMPLLLALSACPQGDVSTPVGLPVPDEKCHSLKVQVFSDSTSAGKL